MGLLKILVTTSVVAIAILAAAVYHFLLTPDPIPKIEDEFWGPASSKNDPGDVSIREFKINIDDKILVDLKSRLKQDISAKRFTPPLEGIGFEYGFNTNYLPKLLSYWADKYDWRQREKLLNKYPHFKTKIEGIDIHFQHVKSTKGYKKTMPLLLLHGWPGSIVEFQKIIPLLSEPNNSDYNYELIIPSLPGYGFSQGASKPGLDTVAMGHIFLKLMNRLGHEKFYIMGGDWGAIIVADMGALFPEKILAVHSTMCSPMTHPFSTVRMFLLSLFPKLLEDGDAEVIKTVLPLGRFYSFLIRETGYFHIQATKPDTVGVGLSNTPSGLLAYILEKFSTWTNRAKIDQVDGGLLHKFTMDELLDNVMIYWVTNSITTSMRLYSEEFAAHKKYHTDKVPITVPTACLQLPEELALSPKFTLKDKFTNLQQYTVGKEGGHFGAFEVPELVAQDALKFFNNLTTKK